MKSAPLDQVILNEIYELNQRFIDLMPELPESRFDAESRELPALLVSSRPEARRQLSRCPFLLFRIDATPAQAAVADAGLARGDATRFERELARIALSFLWQLARANPFAARVVSGTPAHWCEGLASLTIVRLIETATTCDIEVRPRLAAVPGFWCDLLGASGARPPMRRRTIGIAGLQLIMSKSRRKRAPVFLPLGS